jgi:hypothetical protein
MKVMGAGRPGGTTFMEDYTYHLGPGAPPCPRQPHLPRISWPATTPANTGPTPTTATRLPHPREQSVTGRRSTDIQLAP